MTSPTIVVNEENDLDVKGPCLKELPMKIYFEKNFIVWLRQRVDEITEETSRLVERMEDLEVESESNHQTKLFNDIPFSFVTKQTAWNQFESLQSCQEKISHIIKRYEKKINESVALSRKEAQEIEEKEQKINQQLIDSISDCSSIESGYTSSELDSSFMEEFQDVEPVKGKAARRLNESVIARMKAALGDDENAFESFKLHAMQFGTGDETAEEFYRFLQTEMSHETINSIIFDFARLLALENCRIPLLKIHYRIIYEEKKRLRMEQQVFEAIVKEEEEQQQQEEEEELEEEAQTQIQPSFNQETVTKAKKEDDFDFEEIYDSEDDDHIDEFPSSLRLSTVNHLIFVIHGIGQHMDFQEGEFKSWNGKSGLEGGNHSFRDLFRTCLETTFREIPVSLEMQSIEWHEELHEPTGVDDVFDLICPEGSSGIREFNKETLMDVLYYLSPRYGQLIVDTVTDQLNQKYHIFMEEHPGWDGQISIFAHSLGSVISYDILTHENGSVSSTGVIFKGLDFEVENFFAAGSPVPVMILSRGDLQMNEGQFQPGIKMPRCKSYFNIFHPIDPIAYRVEPLIKHEMHEKPPVQLISAHSVRGLGFIKLQEMWERITAPIHGFACPRIDYVMRRRKREGIMMEYAFAAASHSSYWISEDVVMFTMMQICRPVIEKLHRYMSARKPLPLLVRHVVELSPHSKIQMTSMAFIRESCTGLSHERVILLDHDRLYILPRIEDVACKKKWRLQLTPRTKAVYGDDSFTLKIIANDSTPVGDPKSIGSPGAALLPPPTSTGQDAPPNSTTAVRSEVYVLKAPTTTVRDDWINSINRAVLRMNGTGSPRRMASPLSSPTSTSGMTSPTDPPSRRLRRPRVPDSTEHLMSLPPDMNLDFFHSVKSGFLHEKTPKGWYEGWTNRWIVLQEDAISCYESNPKLLSANSLAISAAAVANATAVASTSATIAVANAGVNTPVPVLAGTNASVEGAQQVAAALAAAMSFSSSTQFKLKKTRICCYDSGFLFRIVTKRGTSIEMRMKDLYTYEKWLKRLDKIPYTKMIRHEDVLENSPSAVLMTMEDSMSSNSSPGIPLPPLSAASMSSLSMALSTMSMSNLTTHDLVTNSTPMIQTKIEGYQLALDDKNNQYAAFVIQILVVFPTNRTPVPTPTSRNGSSSSIPNGPLTAATTTSTIVHRRFSEFAALHRKLRSIFPHEQVPILPNTRLWNKLDPKYLKEKAVALHGYLGQVCKRCMTSPRGKIVFLEFLDIIPSSSSTTSSISGGQIEGRTTRASSIASEASTM